MTISAAQNAMTQQLPYGLHHRTRAISSFVLGFISCFCILIRFISYARFICPSIIPALKSLFRLRAVSGCWKLAHDPSIAGALGLSPTFPSRMVEFASVTASLDLFVLQK